MKHSLLLSRIVAAVVCCISLLFSTLTSAQVSGGTAQVAASAADLAKIQESLNQMRDFYEKRIHALEGKVDTLQKQNTQLSQKVQSQVQQAQVNTQQPSSVIQPAQSPGQRSIAPAQQKFVNSPLSAGKQVTTQATLPTASEAAAASSNAAAAVQTPTFTPSLARGITLPKIGVVTPEISLILDGKYSNQSQNPDAPIRGFLPSGGERTPRGFSLGESELSLAGTVDNLFRAEARFVLSQDENGTSFAVEEAFFETLGLPDGFKLKGGKFFSDVGYLNNKHPHEWDFVDLPLAYQAFFGGQLNNTGVQLKWVAPLDDMYLRFGAEYAQGGSYPNSNNYNQNKPLLGTLFAKAGGDIGVSSSWQGGLSFVRAGTGNRPRTSVLSDTESFDFSGTTNVYIADFVYKWAPNGNATRQNFKLQGEFFWNTQNGSGVLNAAAPSGECDAVCIGQAYSATQKGFYVQAIYQFMPGWRVGYRYDQLYSGTSTYGMAPGVMTSPVLESWNPNRNTVMLDWANSEYSMIRLQLARDTSLGPNLTNNQVFLQYIMSIGAHGAHKY